MAEMWRGVRGLGLAIAVSFVFELVYLAWTGPDPECGARPAEVGPCGYWEMVRAYGGLLVVFAMFMGVTAWATWLLVAAAVRRLSPAGQKNPSFLGE